MVSVAVVWVVVDVNVATLLHAAEIFSGAHVATRAGVATSRFLSAFAAKTIVVVVSVATTTVVVPEEMSVLVVVTAGGVDVVVSVVVVRVTVETVAAMRKVSSGGV
jgi:hypothetical protein